MGGWWVVGVIGVGPSNFKIGLGVGSGIEGADGVNFEIGTPDPDPFREELRMIDACWIAVAVVVALAGGGVVGLTPAGGGGFAGADCVSTHLFSLVAQVTQPCTGCASNRSACEIRV